VARATLDCLGTKEFPLDCQLLSGFKEAATTGEEQTLQNFTYKKD
jgi:hypothetical protein